MNLNWIYLYLVAIPNAYAVTITSYWKSIGRFNGDNQAVGLDKMFVLVKVGGSKSIVSSYIRLQRNLVKTDCDQLWFRQIKIYQDLCIEKPSRNEWVLPMKYFKAETVIEAYLWASTNLLHDTYKDSYKVHRYLLGLNDDDRVTYINTLQMLKNQARLPSSSLQIFMLNGSATFRHHLQKITTKTKTIMMRMKAIWTKMRTATTVIKAQMTMISRMNMIPIPTFLRYRFVH